jgi:hypothetical protein
MKIKKYNEFYNSEIYINIDVKKLMNRVELDCGNISDLDVISEHKSYKEVVNNGFDSIPFILKKINENKCHVIWIRALNEITGKSVYDIYETARMIEFWKKWALENGY